MRCEVCGRKIFGKPYKVIIEEAKLTVCNECSKHGKIYYEEEKPKAAPQLKPKAILPSSRIQAKMPQEPTVDTNIELAENFDAKIRQAREKLGLSHEDLGKKLNEKVSLLRKIETGRIKPDNKLVTKLEHILKIKLLVPAKEEKIPQTKGTKTMSRELTLGDLIQLDKKDKGKEDAIERKPS